MLWPLSSIIINLSFFLHSYSSLFTKITCQWTPPNFLFSCITSFSVAWVTMLFMNKREFWLKHNTMVGSGLSSSLLHLMNVLYFTDFNYASAIYMEIIDRCPLQSFQWTVNTDLKGIFAHLYFYLKCYYSFKKKKIVSNTCMYWKVGK